MFKSTVNEFVSFRSLFVLWELYIVYNAFGRGRCSRFHYQPWEQGWIRLERKLCNIQRNRQHKSDSLKKESSVRIPK